MTKEQMESEIYYKMSLKLLKALLFRELITQEEFYLIDKLNRIKFSPELKEVYM